MWRSRPARPISDLLNQMKAEGARRRGRVARRDQPHGAERGLQGAARPDRQDGCQRRLQRGQPVEDRRDEPDGPGQRDRRLEADRRGPGPGPRRVGHGDHHRRHGLVQHGDHGLDDRRPRSTPRSPRSTPRWPSSAPPSKAFDLHLRFVAKLQDTMSAGDRQPGRRRPGEGKRDPAGPADQAAAWGSGARRSPTSRRRSLLSLFQLGRVRRAEQVSARRLLCRAGHRPANIAARARQVLPRPAAAAAKTPSVSARP